MFGMKAAEVEKLVDGKLNNLRRDLERKLRDAGSSSSAQDALRELIARLDPVEFLNNLLVTRGLTIEGLVDQAVGKRFKRLNSPDNELMQQIVEEVTEHARDAISESDLSATLAKQLLQQMTPEERAQIFRDVAENLHDEVWDNLNMDDLYLIIGEKIVELLQKKG